MNFAIAQLTPLLGIFAAITLQREQFIPKPFELPMWCLIALLALYFLRDSLTLIRPVKDLDAALEVDRTGGTKERFVTLAWSEDVALSVEQRESARAVEAQADYLAERYDPKLFIRFRLERISRLSFISAPVLVLLSIILLLQRPAPASLVMRGLPTAADQASSLRELVKLEQSLPSELKQELVQLADTIEEKGLTDAEALTAVNDALESTLELESSSLAIDELDLSREVQRTANQQFPAPPPANRKDHEKEDQQSPRSRDSERQSEKSEQAEKHPEDRQSGKADEERKRSEQAETNKEQGAKEREESSQEEKPGEDGEEGKEGEKKKSGSEEGESGSKGSGQSGSEGGKKGDGDKEQREGTTQEGDSGQSEQAKETGNKEGGQQDDKKDTTGVGEGRGKGHSGSGKEQHGEAQSGSDDTGAKEGDAKNKVAAGTKKGDGSGSAGGNNPDGGSKGSSFQRVKEELGRLKDEMERKGEGSGGGDKQEAGKEGDAPENDAQSSKLEKGGTTGKEVGEKNSANNQDARSSNGKENDSKSSSDKDSAHRVGEPDSGDEKPSIGKKGDDSATEKEGDKSEQSAKIGKPRDAGPDGDQDATQDPSHSPSQRPSDTGRRYGPFGGGNEGGGIDRGEEQVQVQIPDEEKIVVRGVGSQDPERYKNSPGASARTALGSEQFEKPKPEVGKTKQPIPVEYRELLR